jgi:hypothetical protein
VNRELGTTTALITHNRSIEGMADRVLRFADGRIAEVVHNAERCAPETLLGSGAPRPKLLRDLWRVRGQALAIAMIVASGRRRAGDVADGHAGPVGLERRLLRACPVCRRIRHREARAGRLGADLAAIDGVQLVELRVVQFAMLDMPAMREPVVGRLVSLPDAGEPLLNRLTLSAGRMPDPRVPTKRSWASRSPRPTAWAPATGSGRC